MDSLFQKIFGRKLPEQDRAGALEAKAEQAKQQFDRSIAAFEKKIAKQPVRPQE